jgi:nitrite reductase/ring-hydroxylating ferredoxin subunit
LQEVRFSVSINLSLPSYNNLTSVGNPIYINEAGVGTRGVYVMNVGFDQFRAFEASCANHIPSSCSILKIKGQSGTCDCDELSYSLFTGQLLNRPADGVYYDLLEYSTQLSGDVLRIYN